MTRPVRRSRRRGPPVRLDPALAFVPCAMCEPSGWVEREINGVRRAVRCSCWSIHRERIASLQTPPKESQ